MKRRDILKGIMGVLVAGPSCVDVLKASDVHTMAFDPLSSSKSLTKEYLGELIEVPIADLPPLDSIWSY